MASNPDEPEDKTPTNFVMKVYETKALAETGKDEDALYIFENGVDADDDATDPRVSNGSQFFIGTTTSSGNPPTTLVDSNSNTTFSSRLNGKKITIAGNITTITGVSSDGKTLTVADSGANTASYHIHAPGHFFIFNKYFYRIESTDPVSGFIIDWDDGEDNSPEKANREVIKLDSPRYYAVTDHIYTTHGVHYPMIRTISPEGYYSKWYVSHDAINFLSSIETQTLEAGQNDFSIVSLDKEQTNGTLCRIPEFAPANMPPVGILKTDRTSVFSGIDNEVIVNTEDKGYCIVDARSGAVTSFTNGVEVIYRTTSDRILKETLSPRESGETTPAAAIFPSDTSTNGFLKEVLSVKIVKLLETTDSSVTTQLMADERIHVLRYNSTNSAVPNHLGNDVITTVSLGNPIQTLDRAGFFVTADGSQSQTRASNVSINKYWFEDGKMSGTIRQEPAAGFGQSDYFGFSVDDFDQTESSKVISYTFNHTNEGSVKDPNTQRYFDEERLIRLQVEDTSATTRNDGTTYYTGGTALSSIYITNNIGTSGVDLTVTAGHGLVVGDVISPEASGDTRELMQVIALNIEAPPTSGTSIKVKRAFQGTTAENYDGSGSALPIYLLGDNGRQGDSLTRSFIEHWEPSIYADDINRPSSIHSRGLMLYANPTDSSADAATGINLGTEMWRNASPENNNNSWFGSSTTWARMGDPHVVFGGTLATTVGAYSEGTFNRVQLTAGGVEGHTKHPTNFLLCCKTDKFNKIYFDIENRNNSESSPYNLFANLILWYTAKTTKTVTEYKWKPLSFVDGTSTGGANTSLRLSGTIAFDMPEDWVSVKASDVSTGAPVRFDDLTANDPLSLWTESMYGLLIGIAIDGSTGASALGRLRCKTVFPYNNAHSQIITLTDAHHKSLNDVAIAQSISWNRKGKFIEITDRLGRTEVRKIGSAGGSIKFGGVELSGDYTTTKAALLRYQREGTPVYLDVKRVNGDYVRIFGVITSMTEDFPTGLQHPKFGIQMQTEYIIEYDSSGSWITDGIMSLGGEITNEPKYLL